MTTAVENKPVLLTYPTDEDVSRSSVIAVDVGRGLTSGDSTRFSPRAAIAAAVLAVSSADEAMLCKNLSLLNYHDISCVAFDNADRNRIGICMATGESERGRHVIVVLRGTVGEEWYSNFDIGYGSEHHGFATAADYAELRLSDYLFTRLPGVEPELFITGYSRGGAVANILAKRLCDRYGTDRVRAYTLASPHTTLSSRGARYGSIFNLVRDEDFFTRVPLAGWGYTKYGRSISLSDVGDTAARFFILTGREYIGFRSSAAVDDFLCTVMTLAPNVHAYYERRRPVGERMMSVHEFMLYVAQMLADCSGDEVADVMMAALGGVYADMVSFLSDGADLLSILTPSAALPRCSVADSHSAAAYMAAVSECLG